MAILGSATYKLFIDNSRLNRGLTDAEKSSRESSKRIAGNFKKMGAGTLAAGAAMGFALFKVGKGAFELEKQFAEVRTLLPKVGAEAFGALQKDVIALSNELGMAAQDVIPALYQAISAGVPTENVISFLRTSGKAAIGGVTDLTSAVDGISSVVNAYADSSFTAANASDLMFTAVRLGKTTFDELSRSLFNAVPVAASLGVGFDQITASLAAMTAQGVPTKIATTGLRQLFVEMSKDGMELADVIQNRYGKSLSALMDEGKDFTVIMNEIAASMPSDEFRNMFSSVEAMNAAMLLVGPGGVLVADALAEMRSSAGATEKAFQVMADTAGFKLSRALNTTKNTFKVAFMTVLPVIEKLLPWVQSVVTSFTEWAERNPKLMRALVIGAAAVTVLTLALGAALLAISAIIFIAPAAAIAWGIAIGPVGWIALALGLAAVAAYLLWRNWDTLKEKWPALEMVEDSAKAFWDFGASVWDLGKALFDLSQAKDWEEIEESSRSVGDALYKMFDVEGLKLAWEEVKVAWNVSWAWVKEAAAWTWDWLKEAWNTSWGWLKDNVLKPAWDGIKGAWDASWAWVDDTAGTIWDWLKEAWNTSWGFIKGVLTGAWDGISTAWDASWAWVGDTAGTIWDFLKAVWNTSWSWLKDNVLKPAWDGIKTAWDASWKWIADVAGTVWDFLKAVWNTSWSWLKDNVLKPAWDGIKTAWGVSWDWVSDTAGTVWDFLKEVWNTSWGWLKDNVLSPAWDGVKTAWDTSWKWIADVAGTVWDGLNSAWDTAWGGLKTLVKNAINTIIGWINTMISAWNGIEFRVPTISLPSVTLGGGSFLGIDIPSKTIGGGTLGGQTFSTPNIAHIPSLGEGGIVTGPTLARIGEDGREAVVPLDSAGGLGRGLTVKVYMDGATILEADDAEQYIVDMVDRAVRRGVVLGAT